MALYTFQSWAPAGGAGNRTGRRGGGPLVTMVMPGSAPTMWQTLWANVPQGGEPPALEDLPRIFPWLAPTVLSDGAMVVTPQTAHQLQCWWGMPRRIRLDFTLSEAARSCDLTGHLDTVRVTSWRQRPRGANYADWGQEHPLTPRYQQKSKLEWLAVHPQPGGIGYRHWLGLVLASDNGLRLPAPAISQWRNGRGANVGGPPARLVAAGFDMDNMKARGFVESEMPLPAAAENDRQNQLDDLARQLVEAADQVASLLRSAVRNALFSAGATVKPDAAVLNAVRERLWENTETRFFSLLETATRHTPEVPDANRTEWLKHLRSIALALFDEIAPLSADSGGSAAARIGKARRFLGMALAGYGPAGAALFATLAQPAVESKETRKKRKAP